SPPVILRNLSNPGSKNAFATSACDRREDPSSLHALRSSREIHETVYWQFRGRPPPNRRFDWASARIAIPRVQLPFGLVANFVDAGVIRALVLNANARNPSKTRSRGAWNPRTKQFERRHQRVFLPYIWFCSAILPSFAGDG